MVAFADDGGIILISKSSGILGAGLGGRYHVLTKKRRWQAIQWLLSAAIFQVVIVRLFNQRLWLWGGR